jgi:hypothetical protein
MMKGTPALLLVAHNFEFFESPDAIADTRSFNQTFGRL